MTVEVEALCVTLDGDSVKGGCGRRTADADFGQL